MKKKLFFVLGLLMAVVVQAQTYWNGTSDKTFSGSGTQTDPYLIGTPEQLAGLAERVNADKEDFAGQYIKLTADIYLCDFADLDSTHWHDWEPIGYHEWDSLDSGIRDTCFFRGHFDGDDHTVYNMYYGEGIGWGDSLNLNPYDWENNNMEELNKLTFETWFRGLFGFVKGSVENVTVANAKLCGVYISPLATYVGKNAIVRNCHATNNKLFSSTGGNNAFIGTNCGLIENCSVSGDYSEKNTSVGLVGTNEQSGIIRNCSANVSSANGSFYAIVSNNKGLIEQTHSIVDITTSESAQGSGFVFNNEGTGIIRDCYSSGRLKGSGVDIARWSTVIAGFCVLNTATLESCYSTCDLTDLGTIGNAQNTHVKMAGFVYANGIWPVYTADIPIPGVSINCFYAGSFAFSDYAENCAVNSFLAGYAGSTNSGGVEYGVPSQQINCFWNENGFPVALDKNRGPVGKGVTLAYMQSQAFVDELNRMATFMGTSQWEYREGQLPRATGVRIQDKSLFFAQGDGSKSNPYLITSKTDLETLAELTNKGYDFRNEYFKQTADIELNAPFEQWGEIAPTKWQTIGGEYTHSYYSGIYPTYFLGNYDGDFHEVKNMYINATLPTQGLFGYVGRPFAKDKSLGDQYITPSVIRNLGVTDIYVRAPECGGIVGNLGDLSALIQCWSSGSIYAISSSTNATIAGLASIVNSRTHILNCQTSVSLIPGNTGTTCKSFSGEIGTSGADTIVNAFYNGTTQQAEFGYAYYSSTWGGKAENVFRDTTKTHYKDIDERVVLCSTERLQSKKIVNMLNTTVTQWNSTHDEDKQLDYWEWRENDYPRVSPNAASQLATVTFESNGGSAVMSMNVLPNSQIDAPIRPTKEGYVFAAWYRDADCTDFFDFKRDSVQAAMTLYAKWLIDDRNVYDLSPFQKEFASTYHIKTAAQLRGLVVAVSGAYDWSPFPFNNTYLPTAIVSPMDFTGKTVVLDNDILLNDTADWKQWGNNCYAVPWIPIGYCPNGYNSYISYNNFAFKGTFDGQGHTIYGMYMEMGTIPQGGNAGVEAGLFSRLSGGTIRNVGVEASVIDLRRHDDTPNLFNSSYIWGDGNLAGLLVGALSAGTIEQCYAIGRIIPHEQYQGYPDIDDSALGGLIGKDAFAGVGTVANSYARVDIIREQKDDTKGYGISGYPRLTDNKNISYSNCYSAGHTSQGNNIATTYYDKELVTTTATNNSAKSTYEMHTMNAYANWDFETVWARNYDVNEGYPVLRIFHPEIENSPDPVTVTGITLQPTSSTVISGESIQLNASVLPADAGNQKINWTVSNATYGEVDENGLVQTYYIASKAGGTQSLIVTATTDDGGYVKRCTLNIQYPTVSLKLLKSRRIGETEWGSTQATSITNFYWVYGREYLVATYTTPVVTHTPFTWTSSDETLMTVESLVDDTTYMDGNNERRGSMAVFRCLATGSATLTATSEKGYIGKHTRTIKKYPATSITVAPTSASLYVGETQQLTATMTPSYATTEVEWTADDPNVVLVSETGLVTAVGAGTTAVTATAGNYSATCTFTVESNTFYTIFFLDDDAETELWSTQVREGETPVYAGPTPTKDSTDAVVYTFNGWTPELAPATEDAFYIATYSESVRQYTIRFLNWDDEELQSSLVDFGELPVYTGETPAKPSDNEYIYVFNGWLPEIIAVSGNADYTAQFSATLKPQPACDPVVCDFTKKANGHSNYNDKWTYDDNWEIFGGANNNNGWAYVKMGGKSATLSSANPVYVVNKNAFECEIASVKVTFPAGSFDKSGMSCNNWGVKVYSDLACTQLLYTVNGGTISNSAAELTIEAQENEPWSAGCAIQVYWDLANSTTTNGIVWVSKIEYIPTQSTLPTDIQNVSDSANNVARKVLINGQLFILRDDGTIFDARGVRVK